MAVDNLPCEFPRESSIEFSAVLRDFVAADRRRRFQPATPKPGAALPHSESADPAARRFRPRISIHERFRKIGGTTMKKILVLGAGLVSRPGVNYLLEQKNLTVTVASRTVSKAEKLVKGHANGRAVGRGRGERPGAGRLDQGARHRHQPAALDPPRQGGQPVPGARQAHGDHLLRQRGHEKTRPSRCWKRASCSSTRSASTRASTTCRP